MRPRLVRVRRKPLDALALIMEDGAITLRIDGVDRTGRVQIIDDRPGHGDDTWLLRDERELREYYDVLED